MNPIRRLVDHISSLSMCQVLAIFLAPRRVVLLVLEEVYS
ncbi:hypothetical protein BH23GEM3_BH23GEM3_10340 [soil metagenome]